jgi:hypothetical protein
MPKSSLTCVYCGANNPAGTARCNACGAPIEIPVTPPVRVTMVNNQVNKPVRRPVTTQRAETTPEQVRDALEAAPINEQLKEGLKAVGVGAASLGVGSFVARTAAESVAIAFSALLCGYFGARGGHFGLGLLGGVVIGLLVGLVVKRPLGVLISAPISTIGGLAAGFFLQETLPGLPLPVLLGMAGGGLFAVIGGRRSGSNVISKWYGRIRPFLGMAGGFLFALLGYTIGGLIR